MFEINFIDLDHPNLAEKGDIDDLIFTEENSIYYSEK